MKKYEFDVMDIVMCFIGVLIIISIIGIIIYIETYGNRGDYKYVLFGMGCAAIGLFSR